MVEWGMGMAIKARQDETLTTLTPDICACFEVIEAVMRFRPKREFSVLPFYGERFLAASDAAIEEDTGGSGGFHLIFFQSDRSQIRLSFVATNCTELQFQWQPAVTHIAQLELAMVLYALVERPDLFRGRRGLWFLDNVAAVMTLVRGRSTNSDLSKLGHLIHLALFVLWAQGYWEYVQSKSNWADDISRLGFDDPWWRNHGFTFCASFLPTILFHLPFVADMGSNVELKTFEGRGGEMLRGHHEEESRCFMTFLSDNLNGVGRKGSAEATAEAMQKIGAQEVGEACWAQDGSSFP
eukprot:s1601_g10.t1